MVKSREDGHTMRREGPERVLRLWRLLNVVIFFLALKGLDSKCFLFRTCCAKRPRAGLRALPPGKPSWPVFGDTLKLLGQDTMASYQTDCRTRWGNVWKSNVLFSPAVFVTGWEELNAAFRVESRRGTTEACFPPHHRALFGHDSMLVRSGDYHARLRRIILPALSGRAISGYQKYIDAAISDFLASLSDRQGATIRMVDILRSLSVQVVVQALIGQDKGAAEVTSLTSDVATWSRGLLSAPTAFIPWSTAGRAMRARKRIASKLRAWIEAAREAGPNDSMLSRLVHARDEETGETLENSAIVDNIFTLVFAGSDTTASLLSSAILHLSLDAALLEELRDICTGNDDQKTKNVIDAFISEILRTNPPAPFAMRKAKQELQIKNFTVPKDWLLVYGFAGTLLEDGEKYPSPKDFKLDRWLQQDGVDEGAFGGGPRMCPGRYLAIEEARSVITALLRSKIQWKLEAGQNTKLQYTPGLFPKDGLNLQIL